MAANAATEHQGQPDQDQIAHRYKPFALHGPSYSPEESAGKQEGLLLGNFIQVDRDYWIAARFGMGEEESSLLTPPQAARNVSADTRAMFARSRTVPVPTENATRHRENRGPTSTPSCLGSDVQFDGRIVASGQLNIEGHVKGEIRAISLVIGEGAVIEGNIFCERVVIQGCVTGEIHARTVHFAKTCQVHGPVFHQSLTIDLGARFEGDCHHSADPLIETEEVPAPSREKTVGAQTAIAEALRPPTRRSENEVTDG